MKKIISVILSIMMVLTMFPAVAFASPIAACSGYTLGTFNGSAACIDSSGNLHICEKNFPDAKFMKAIKSYDKDSNNVLSTTEAAFNAMKVNKMSINDLSGIEYFTLLNELDCSDNQLKNLDVSKLTELSKVECYNNQLSSLDFSNNKKLSFLTCYRNTINTLNIRNNLEMADLSCEHNLLRTLDVSNNVKLDYLYCDDNQLTSLDVSKLNNLVWLACSDNQLTSLDVSKNTELAFLFCENNQINSLDVSSLSKLIRFDCSNNQLTSLNVSNHKSLRKFFCNINKLTTIDVSNNTSLEEIDCSDNLLKTLDISKNTELVNVSCSNNLLETLDVSNNLLLEIIFCGMNKIKTLDVSKNTNLWDLGCYSNLLSSLDLSHNPELSYLHCDQNNLSTLDLSMNTELRYLECCFNQLKSLDLSKNTQLDTIECSDNQLRTLDFSNNPYLTTVECYRQKSGSVEYKKVQGSYLVSLSDIVGKDNTANIIAVQGMSIVGNDIEANYDKNTGIATFTSEPKEITYIFKLLKNGIGYAKMDVTLTIKRPVDTTPVTHEHQIRTNVMKTTLYKDGLIANVCTVCNTTISSTVIPRVASIKLSHTSYTYNRKEKKPAVVVKDVRGNILKQNVHYRVSYATGRKNVGNYAVKVTFIGNYVGSKTSYFTIKPNTTSIAKIAASKKQFTLKWSKNTSQVTGYQIQYSTSTKFSKAKTVTIGKNTTTQAKISKLSAKKKYYVRVRTYKTLKVNGKNTHIFSDWSKTKSVITK